MKLKKLIDILLKAEKEFGNDIEIFLNWERTGPGELTAVRHKKFNILDNSHTEYNMPPEWLEMK